MSGPSLPRPRAAREPILLSLGTLRSSGSILSRSSPPTSPGSLHPFTDLRRQERTRYLHPQRQTQIDDGGRHHREVVECSRHVPERRDDGEDHGYTCGIREFIHSVLQDIESLSRRTELILARSFTPRFRIASPVRSVNRFSSPTSREEERSRPSILSL